PDYGATWPGNKCCEGFYLAVPRQSLSSDLTVHTGMACAGCGNYRSGPVLTNQTGWNNPPDNVGNPALVSPGRYVQTRKVDSSTWQLVRTEDTGAGWDPVVNLDFFPMSLPLAAGSVSNPSIFLTLREPDIAPNIPKVALMKISGAFTSSPVLSEISGYGNIGTFPTMFAWYEVFGVNPKNPSFIIVPDISGGVVRKSLDGGFSWTPDMNLTNLVTHNGEFKFSWGRFSQISNIAFNPNCDGHIMVGTQEAGIFQSKDHGNTWEMIPGTKEIPYVSSFFFPNFNEVIISSYGRGLWRYRYSCDAGIPPLDLENPLLDRPVLWAHGDLVPLNQLIVPEACVACRFLITEGGSIRDISIDTLTGKIDQIHIDGGEMIGIDERGQRVDDLPDISIQPKGGPPTCQAPDLAKLIGEHDDIKGIYLREGKFYGFILKQTDISLQDLPRPKPQTASIQLLIPSETGISLKDAANLTIMGKRFKPGYPIEIRIDEEDGSIKQEVEFRPDGTFRVKAPLLMGLGLHTIRIRQETNEGILEAALGVHVTVQDFPRN
ncbi:MAG: hypothetical protein AAFV07_16840, partial [Bacteroidota bacterium]